MYAISDHLGQAAKGLLSAWSSLPKHEHVPYRESFDPMAVARILPVITLLERASDGEWRFRLVGTEVDRRWGKSLAGRHCAEIVAPEVATIIRHEFNEVVCRPCGSWSVRRVQFNSGARATIETLRLPLRAADGSVKLILGSSGELSEQIVHQPDLHRTIATIEQQQFFDIGAGVAIRSAGDPLLVKKCPGERAVGGEAPEEARHG